MIETTTQGPGTFPKDVEYYQVLDQGISTYSWCPSNDGSGPATQVHVHLLMSFGRVVVRFKAPESLDAFIAALQKHREDVWGPAILSAPPTT